MSIITKRNFSPGLPIFSLLFRLLNYLASQQLRKQLHPDYNYNLNNKLKNLMTSAHYTAFTSHIKYSSGFIKVYYFTSYSS